MKNILFPIPLLLLLVSSIYIYSASLKNNSSSTKPFPADTAYFNMNVSLPISSDYDWKIILPVAHKTFLLSNIGFSGEYESGSIASTAPMCYDKVYYYLNGVLNVLPALQTVPNPSSIDCATILIAP